MNIFFDHQTFTDQTYGGISRYFSELIAGIDRYPNHKVLLGLWRSNNEYLKQCRPLMKSFFSQQYIPRKTQLLRCFNKHTSLTEARKLNYDIYHPTNYNPYLINKVNNRPIVVTFHDMIHEKFGEDYQLSNNNSTVNFKKIMAEKADKILAVSEYTKSDLIRILKVPKEKIDVIHLGSSMPIIPDNFLPKYYSKESYFLYVGARKNYKNFNTLLLAISPLLKSYKVNLICAGGGA
ncbi:glycosyltransferase, partial [Nostoc sp. CHAB 5834]|nr:glycosyltransferase [Nostoc sp. CHAB 5834]